MPKKTLALIAGLVLVTVILAIIAYRTGKQQQYPQQKPPEQQAQVDMAHTVLSFLPNPVQVGPSQLGTVNVTIDTADNPVTAVQLELRYDPTMLTNVKVTPGPLFPNAVVLISKNNVQTGRMTYAFGIQPSQKPISGTGVVATVTFTAHGAAGKESQITVLPTSLVTARGVAKSVLKSSSGTTVMIGSGTGAATNQTTPATPNSMMYKQTTTPAK